MPTIKDIVKDTEAKFSHCCNGICYYNIDVGNETYQLGIDSKTPEWQTTYLLPQFKAITLMRWIRKALDNNELIRIK